MRRGLCAAVAALAMAAAGCTDSAEGGKPSASPPSSPSPSIVASSTAPVSSSPAPSPSVPTTGPNVRPGEKRPELSQLADHNNAPAAVLFATYWFRALDWGYATTSSALARSLFAATCADCERFVHYEFEKTKNSGQHFRGGRLDLVKALVASNDRRHGAQRAVDVTVKQSAVQTINKQGRVTSHSPAVAATTFRVWMRWVSTHFIVVDWKTVVVK